MVQAFVIAKLEYCNSLLAGLPQRALHKLHVIQHSAALLISGKSFRTYITPAVKQLHWLPPDPCSHHRLATLVFKSLNSESPPTCFMDVLIQSNLRYILSPPLPENFSFQEPTRKSGTVLLLQAALDFATYMYSTSHCHPWSRLSDIIHM